MIKVKGLDYSYTEVKKAISDISFECERGKMIGIVGPNGSGKSTLIKCIAGLLKPVKGEIFLEGQNIKKIPLDDLSKKMAYIPQETYIPFPFSALEVVLMGRAPHVKRFGFETARDVEIAYEAMNETDTGDFATRCIQELSGGEKQRVILARALVQMSRIMLLDEPTASLDIGHRTNFYSLLLKRCRSDGLTVLTSMHDLNSAALFCDKIILLHEGKMIRFGKVCEVLEEKILKEVFDIDLKIFNKSDGREFFISPSRPVS